MKIDSITVFLKGKEDPRRFYATDNRLSLEITYEIGFVVITDTNGFSTSIPSDSISEIQIGRS